MSRAAPRTRASRAARAALAGAILIASAIAAEVRPQALLDPASRAAVLRFVRDLFPADLSPAFLHTVAGAMVRTVAIAVTGTVLAIAVALPLGILATATLFRRGPLVDRERRALGGAAGAALGLAARGVLDVLRAIPDFVWGLVFIVGVGLSPVAGALALAVSYGGVLGRVLAQLFEDVDPRPLEALRATGATRAQIFVFGIWPQALPSAVAYTLYSFECCVRAAMVLGLIGVGGLGYEIALSMRMFEYGQVVTLTGALLVLVWLSDAASTALRRVLRANAPPGLLAHRRLGGAAPRRTSRVAVAVVAVAVVACAAGAGLFAPGVFELSAARRVAHFARALVPPDVSPGQLHALLRPIAQTLGTSVIGTLLGVVLGGVLGIPATAAHAEDDRPRGVAWVARAVLRRGCRATLSLLRAIPEALWVLVFVLAVGLGPFAGALALGVHTGGVLGKLYADTLEEVSPLPLRGLRATGASPLQILVWGAWPEARRMLIGYTVLRWEMNLRVSTVVGLAGGGGIGLALYNDVQLGFYPRVGTLILTVYLLVVATGWIGDRIRRRLGTVSPRPCVERQNESDS